MRLFRITAKALCSEFNITNISKHYGLKKKIKWEEPLILRSELIKSTKGDENKSVYIYHFGALVFINMSPEEIEISISKIKEIKDSIKSINTDMKYSNTEIYNIIEDSDSDEEIEFDAFYTKQVEKYHFNMIALVLAKSVALDNIEDRVDIVFDEIEDTVKDLKKGKLKTGGNKTIAMIGQILSFKHTTISYIMLLDKPLAAWKCKETETFFNDLADFFELSDRYEKLSAKMDTLLTTADIFADLSHSKKSTKLEWIVILLILVEVLHAFEEPILKLLSKLISLI